MKLKLFVVSLAFSLIKVNSAEPEVEVITNTTRITYYVSIVLDDYESPQNKSIRCTGAIVSNHYVLATNDCLNHLYLDDTTHHFKLYYVCLKSVKWEHCKKIYKVETASFNKNLALAYVEQPLGESITIPDSKYSETNSSGKLIAWDLGMEVTFKPLVKAVKISNLTKCGEDKICVDGNNTCPNQLGGLLVVDGKLVGLLNSREQNVTEFVDVKFYSDWINETSYQSLKQ